MPWRIFLLELCYFSWNDLKAQKLLINYLIKRCGSIKDNLHSSGETWSWIAEIPRWREGSICPGFYTCLLTWETLHSNNRLLPLEVTSAVWNSGDIFEWRDEHVWVDVFSPTGYNINLRARLHTFFKLGQNPKLGLHSRYSNNMSCYQPNAEFKMYHYL